MVPRSIIRLNYFCHGICNVHDMLEELIAWASLLTTTSRHSRVLIKSVNGQKCLTEMVKSFPQCMVQLMRNIMCAHMQNVC